MFRIDTLKRLVLCSIIALVAVPAQGTGTTLASPPIETTLSVHSFIDGRSQLILQDNVVYWRHFERAAPGRLWQSTVLKGADWLPTWPDQPTSENRDCRGCESSRSESVPLLAPQAQVVTLDVIQARGRVEIVQQPDQNNGFTLIVEFDDNYWGAELYEINLNYVAGPALNVRVRIDGRSQLILQGDTVYWRHFEAAAPGRHWEGTYLDGTVWEPIWPDQPTSENRDCSGCESSRSESVPPLASQAQVVTLDVVQARERVEIVQQPDQSNGFTLIVEFDDMAPPGAEWYEINLTYQGRPTAIGRIVVNNDEWPLSDYGFVQTPVDAARFARNVASWFTGGQSGNFLVYSTPFGANSGLVGTTLSNTMTAAGHEWTIITATTNLSLDDLLAYDGIFLAGSYADDIDPRPVNPPDTQVLINYVKAGGNVYLAGGTDPFGGDNPDAPADEAAQWNPFLNACGLEFEPVQNDLEGTFMLATPSSHPILAGVQSFYQGDGNSIRQLDPGNPSAAILVQSRQGEGLYAVCTIGGPIEGAPVTAIDLLSFTAQADTDRVTLAWETGTEVDNAGFNLWRSEAAGGPYAKINDALIPAEGDAVSGASYTYVDADVVEGVTYYYRLEDVDIHGASTFHGPVSAKPGRTHLTYLCIVLK